MFCTSFSHEVFLILLLPLFLLSFLLLLLRITATSLLLSLLLVCVSASVGSVCEVGSLSAMSSFVPVSLDSDFPLQNLPFGVFSTHNNVISSIIITILCTLDGEQKGLQGRQRPADLNFSFFFSFCLLSPSRTPALELRSASTFWT